MDAKDKLKTAAVLGALVDENINKGVRDAMSTHQKELVLAADQIGGAHLCIQNAIDILQKIPSIDQSMLMMMLRMDAIRMANFERSLRREGQ